MSKAKVAVVKTKPETVLEDLAKLMQMADFKNHLDASKTTILKDNISWHFPFLSANTTPWQLEGVIQTLQNSGFKDLCCVQNKTVVTNAFKGERLNKYLPIFKKYNINVLYNFKTQDMNWIDYKPKGKMLVLPHIYPEGIRIPEYFLGKNIIHLPTIKTHIYTEMTGSMKNAFGGLLNTRRHYTHSVIHETLVDLLTIQKEIHSGIFTVTDGTVCGSGPGPRTMTPHDKDYLLASADSVAIDAVAAKMLGFNPMNLKFIALAHEAGLGVGKPSEIEMVGEDISKVNFNFNVGDNAASVIGDLLWFGPMKMTQKFFFRTHLVYIFVFGSFFYHDYIWWPFKGKKIMSEFKKTSKWGQLFDKYQE